MKKSLLWIPAALCILLGLGVSRPDGKSAAPRPEDSGRLPIDGQVWAMRYDGGAGKVDQPSAIAVDKNGNVFVTGGSISATTNWDYATIKYSADGGQQWVKRYNYCTTPNIVPKNDIANAIAVDGAGNVYVTGKSADATGAEEYATLKYSPAGVRLWSARSDCGYPHTANDAKAIVLDSAGNIYVTGMSRIYGTDLDQKYDYVTLKYDANGVRKWLQRVDGFSHRDDVAVSIGVDRWKNVYVTGYVTSLFSKRDFLTVKYNSDGNTVWSKNYQGTGTARDEPRAMKVWSRITMPFNIKTDIYVVGYSESNLKGDYATLKYDSSGNSAWVRRYPGTAELPDIDPVGLEIDGQGNAYVTGSGRCGGKFLTLKYDTAGQLKWKREYGAGLGADYARAIAVDASGNVYVTGQSQDDYETSYDFTTVKYDTNGNELWVRRYDGEAHGYDSPKAIVLDKAGFVYVTGYSEGAGTDDDYLTLKYTVD
jgi:hypothetical protein